MHIAQFHIHCDTHSDSMYGLCNMILKFLALSLQHVSLTFTGEISLFRSHKKNRISTQKAVFKCIMIM